MSTIELTPDNAITFMTKAIRSSPSYYTGPLPSLATSNYQYCNAQPFVFELEDFRTVEVFTPAFRLAYRYLDSLLRAYFKSSDLAKSHEVDGIMFAAGWGGKDFLETNVPSGVRLSARLVARPKSI